MCVWFACICIIDTNCHIYILIQNYICFLYRILYSDFFLEGGMCRQYKSLLKFCFLYHREAKRGFCIPFFQSFLSSFIHHQIQNFQFLQRISRNLQLDVTLKFKSPLSCPMRDSLYHLYQPLFKHFPQWWCQSVARDRSEGRVDRTSEPT